MKEKPYVSIITVCYNSAKTIERTILSIQVQAYSNIEYIIIDGGSTDGTVQIIEKYPDVISCYSSEPDQGIYDAINKGIAKSHGDIIGILNSDDWYESDTVNLIVKAFAESDAELIYGDINFIGSDGRERYARPLDIRNMEVGMSLFHPSVFVRKRVYEKIGLFSTQYRIASDYEFLLRCYLNGIQMHYLPRVLADFTQNGISSVNEDLARIETEKIALAYANGNVEKVEQIKEYNHLLMLQKKIPRLYKRILQDECTKPNVFRCRLNKILKEDTPITIYSAGKYGKRICNLFERNDYKVEYFVDQDPDKCMQLICGRKVYSPESILPDSNFVVIANAYQADHISEDLLMRGMIQKGNYITLELLLEQLIR